MSTKKIIHKKYIYCILLFIPITSHIILSMLNIGNIVARLAFTSFFIFITLLYLDRLLIANEVLLKKQSKELEYLLSENRSLKKYDHIKDIMLQISYSINYIKNVDDLMNMIVHTTVEIIDNADAVSILLKNEDDLFEYKAISGFNNPELFKLQLTYDETFLSEWTDSNYTKSKIIKHNYNTLNEDQRKFQDIKDLKIKSTLVTPILVDGNIYGVINVHNINNEYCFTQEDKAVIEYLTTQLSFTIKNLKLMEKTLYLSRYDGLTGAYQRHYFDELFYATCKRALRYKEFFCLCVLDMDNLKKVNDLYGHQAGDAVIKHFSQELKESIRSTDILGRYGGDEFVIIFLNAEIEDVNLKLQEIVQKLKNIHVNYYDKLFNISFSYGVANFPNDSTDPKELFRIADSRMYSFKAQGREENK